MSPKAKLSFQLQRKKDKVLVSEDTRVEVSSFNPLCELCLT